MAEELVRYEVRAGRATVTLDSPANRNALSTRLLRSLRDALHAAGTDDAARVVVLSHTGPVFCSGMDLRESAGRVAGDMPVRAFPDVLREIVDSPKPVIARVGGPARAGGIGLLAACDIAVAATAATFAFTEVRLGLVPALIAPTVLQRLAAPAARELFLTGEVFDATRAARLGLLNAAVDDVDGEVARYVQLLLQGGPAALAAAKELLRERPTTDDLPRLLDLSARLFAGDEAREGIAAFAGKRPPRWSARPDRPDGDA